MCDSLGIIFNNNNDSVCSIVYYYLAVYALVFSSFLIFYKVEKYIREEARNFIEFRQKIYDKIWRVKKVKIWLYTKNYIFSTND